MDKQSSLFLLVFALLLWILPFNVSIGSHPNENGGVSAESKTKNGSGEKAISASDNRNEVFEFLEQAYQAQVSLSEKERTMAEVESTLDPFFTEEYKSLFIKENVVGQENRYLTYGTDFAPYYIPFYAFSEKTKIVDMGKEVYVVEYFPGNSEGPVSYGSHYEGLRIVKDHNKLKVAEYLYDEIPEEVLNKAYPEAGEQQKSSAANPAEKLFARTLGLGYTVSSLDAFVGFDTISLD